MKIGVCIRAKDEDKIIVDWVRHYVKLGFDRIIIYDNLSQNPIKKILDKKNLLITNKIKVFIDDIPYSNQPIIYQKAIDRNKDLDWLLLCDADEFLWIKDGNIKDFLSKYHDDVCTVLINWLVYGTSKLEKYDTSKTIFEQFIYREKYNHFWNQFVKSFVRPKLIEKFGNVHITINEKYKTNNVYNETVQVCPDRCDLIDNKLSDETPLLLVHYMTLDFESMEQKYKRNHKGGLLLKEDEKYSKKWYNLEHYGLLDDIIDCRFK